MDLATPMPEYFRARIFHKSLAATTYMAVLPGVLGCRPLRRTVQVRLGTNTLRLPGGKSIFFALATLRSVPQAGSQFRDLATAIHEISGLIKTFFLSRLLRRYQAWPCLSFL